jgi:Fe-S-cluster containining protein
VPQGPPPRLKEVFPMFNMKAVQPTRLDLESKFKFRCHPGVSCFTRCCSNIDIMLTPYDVLRMKKRLGITSEEFLVKYTVTRVDEKSSHPYAYLKMEDGDERLCPFLKSKTEGCSIYEDRPVICRYYPVGQTTLRKEDDEGKIGHEEFYFFVKEDHCKGYEEDTRWTVQEWRDDQGAEHFDGMNREWKQILMRRNIPGQPPLSPKKQQQFFIASYDLDSFRRFVFDSNFLNIFDIPEEEIEQMRTDEVALMKFGFRYIKYVMMLEETLKLKEGVAPKPQPKKDEAQPEAGQ